MLSENSHNRDDFIDIKLPRPVGDKLSVAEIVIDTILLIIVGILMLVWGVFWISTWFVIGLPIFLVLLAISQGVNLILSPFSRDKKR